jgi:non-ribosomal peptide synthetase component E (peptide arylation enzyme)
VVIPVGGAAPSLDELRRHVFEAGLARPKAPERLVLVGELPRTAAGKVKKFELRRSVAGDQNGR